MAFARHVLEKQRLVDAAKLKSVEDKYTSVKSLYLGVEVCDHIIYIYPKSIYNKVIYEIKIFSSL